MMIRTAGGPGPVSPPDFSERRRPLPRATWMAIGVVGAAHIAVGVGLYYQRFEVALPPVIEVEPVDGIVIDLPRPKPPEPKVLEAPQPPNAARPTPQPSQPTETFAAVTTDNPSTSTTITVAHAVPEPTPDAMPTPEPPKPAPAVIRNPSWISQPNADQMMRAYPGRAQTAGVSGLATLNCAVGSNGSVSDCNVTGETPGGYGFGRAAQGLSRHFRVNPRTIDGAAVDARVNINLRFNLPQ